MRVKVAVVEIECGLNFVDKSRKFSFEKIDLKISMAFVIWILLNASEKILKKILKFNY